MRTLVISDLHLGAWTGDALLSRPFARERLAPHLEEIDELVLLGDVFDFLFSTVDDAFAAAEPFFDLVAEKLKGGRVVFSAGNHDHHITVRDLRAAVEIKVATGLEGEALSEAYRTEHRNFFQRYLDRKLEGVETEMVYPSYRVGDVLLCHGHFLDAHMEGSFSNRLLTHAVWRIAGGEPADDLTIADYESVTIPLTELLFTVAQLPRGQAAQESFHSQLDGIGRVLHYATSASRGLRRVGSLVSDRARRAERALDEAVPHTGKVDRSRHAGAARAAAPTTAAPLQLSAFGQVVRNLGWDQEYDKVVFAHTHQPLSRATDPACPGVRFWNTGSWIYEPTLGSREDYARYLERAWPGTGVVIDSDRPEPELVQLLADQNPLVRGSRRDELRQGVSDEFTDRAARYDRQVAGTGLPAAPPAERPAKPSHEAREGQTDGQPTWTLSSSASDLHATFAPQAGMIGCSLRHRDAELLGQRDGLAAYVERGSTMGIPLLHPWANRLEGFSYEVDGKEVVLDRDSPLLHLDPGGLPIHGLLAASPHWTVRRADVDDDGAVLEAELDFVAHDELLDAFPFPHAIAMTVRLRGSVLSVHTTVTPSADLPVPVSFGFHPYLTLPGVDRADWHLELPVRRHVLLDERGIPTGETEPVEHEPGPLGDRVFDDAYDELADPADFVLAGGGRTITLSFGEGYPVAQVFAPQGSDFICFEPMTAPVNALVRGGPELPRVAPGDTYAAEFSIEVAGG